MKQSPHICRLVIRILTDDIGGDPCARHVTVARAAFETLFHRAFDDSRDFLHCPAEIDRPSRKCFIFIDVDAANALDVELDDVPISCYLAVVESPATGIL